MLANSVSFLCLTKLTGRILWSIVYLFFSKPITCSTWIRTLASLLKYSTSCWLNCFLPWVNAGISSLALWRPRSSDISSPCQLGLHLHTQLSLMIHYFEWYTYLLLFHPNTWTKTILLCKAWCRWETSRYCVFFCSSSKFLLLLGMNWVT